MSLRHFFSCHHPAAVLCDPLPNPTPAYASSRPDGSRRLLVPGIGLPCTLDGECIGDKFYAFYLLEFNGVNYRTCQYSARYEILRCLLKKSNGAIELVPSYYSPEIKRAEFALLKKARAEGVVFKKHDAPYSPGRPSRGGPQLKYKFVATGTFIVAGVNAGKRSVGLEVYKSAGVRVYVGNVTIPASHKMPAKGSLVEVRYLYAFQEGCLFQPVYLGVRDDVDLNARSITQLKYKPKEEDGE